MHMTEKDPQVHPSLIYKVKYNNLKIKKNHNLYVYGDKRQPITLAVMFFCTSTVVKWSNFKYG